MACMEHVCKDCGHTTFNNNSWGSCPKCGGECAHYFDEEPEPPGYDYDREDWPGNDPDED